MDDHTRRDVDEACLRLIGWQPDEWWPETQQWRAFPPGGHILMFCSPSRDDRFVVPLAEALHDRGFLVRMFQTTTEGKRWSVSIVGKDDFGFLVAEESGDTLPECLAKATARAVGTETER